MWGQLTKIIIYTEKETLYRFFSIFNIPITKQNAIKMIPFFSGIHF